MNISEKLTTIAENEPKIYEKGKTNFGYKKSVSGSYLYIDDINQNEKELDITLTSDTITDFSNIKLTVCGKNILKGWKNGAHAYADGKYNDNSVAWTINYITTELIPVKSNTKYSTSNLTYTEKAEERIPMIDGVLFYDKNKKFISADARQPLTDFTTVDGCAYIALNNHFTNLKDMVFMSEYVATSQLEEGDATEYEPYTATEYTVNADGVLSVTPYYPITNMFTDNANVTINTEYYADSEKIIGELTDTIISLGGTLDV